MNDPRDRHTQPRFLNSLPALRPADSSDTPPTAHEDDRRQRSGMYGPTPTKPRGRQTDTVAARPCLAEAATNNGYKPRWSGLVVQADMKGKATSSGDSAASNRAPHPLSEGRSLAAGQDQVTNHDVAQQCAQQPDHGVGDTPASWRVRRARRRARVQIQLAAVPDLKVTTARQRVARAATLEDLAGDPRAEAWANRRFRTWALSTLAILALGGTTLSAVFSALSVTTALALTGPEWFTAAAIPDVLMGAMLALTLAMRAVLAQRGLTISRESARAYQRVDRVLGSLIAVIAIGPSLGAAIVSGYRVLHAGAHLGVLGWASVSVAVRSIGPAVVALAALVAPAVTGDLARIAQHTAQRIRKSAATSRNAATSEHGRLRWPPVPR